MRVRLRAPTKPKQELWLPHRPVESCIQPPVRQISFSTIAYSIVCLTSIHDVLSTSTQLGRGDYVDWRVVTCVRGTRAPTHIIDQNVPIFVAQTNLPLSLRMVTANTDKDRSSSPLGKKPCYTIAPRVSPQPLTPDEIPTSTESKAKDKGG